MPKLSIIIPCYNCEKTLEEAVSSCYVQGFDKDEFEVVMVNDGSTDRTSDLMREIAESHKNIKLIFHEKNMGGGAARNTAIEYSKAETIFCLDSDDILPSNTLNMMLMYLSLKKCDGVCFEKSVKFRGTDTRDILYINTFEAKDGLVPVQSLIEWDLSPVLLVFMFKKKAWKQVGGYPTQHGFDTQGFGWRFLLSGLSVYICPNTTYLHRVQYLQSYYLREYEAGKVNLNMKEILLENHDLFTKEAQKIITSNGFTMFAGDLMTELKKRTHNKPFIHNLKDKLGSIKYTNLPLINKNKPIPRKSFLGLCVRIYAKIMKSIYFLQMKLFSLIGKVERHVYSTFVSFLLPKRNGVIFYKRYENAKKHYLRSVPSFRYKKFLMPEWQRNTEIVEKYFLNNFSSSFLRHPLLKSTMFAHLPNKAKEIQKTLLKSCFETNQLKEILKESLIGYPILNDLEYLTSGNSIHHLYHLAKFGKELELKVEKLDSFIELGGGYGNMAKLVKRINPSATYTIIDIPIFIYIQYVYLCTLLGEEQVVIVDKDQPIISSKINLVPLDESLTQNSILQKSSPDIFLSTWALSESNEETQAFVRNNNYFGAKYILLAYQKANNSFQFSQEVTKLGNLYSVIYNSVTEYMPDNFYLFAKRK